MIDIISCMLPSTINEFITPQIIMESYTGLSSHYCLGCWYPILQCVCSYNMREFKFSAYRDTFTFRITFWLQRIFRKKLYTIDSIVSEIIESSDVYAMVYINNIFCIRTNSVINAMMEEHKTICSYYNF